jgi:hypothetical protein
VISVTDPYDGLDINITVYLLLTAIGLMPGGSVT